jgi:CheY-like chemotaxis protein
MGKLVLIVEHDQEARRKLRRKLEGRRHEVVEAGSVMAALELIQRLPSGFRLILTQVDMPGLPGTALVETLRLFHPGIPVFCLAADQEAAVVIGCPRLSDGAEELEKHLSGFSDGGAYWREPSRLPVEIARRARDRYARTGDLVEAAYEVAKGLPPG